LNPEKEKWMSKERLNGQVPKIMAIVLIAVCISMGFNQIAISSENLVNVGSTDLNNGIADETTENISALPELVLTEIIEEPNSEPWPSNRQGDMNSPEIFFHVKEPMTIDVTVRIPERVTLTIPEVQMGSVAVWENVHALDDGNILFDGEKYPYLYYEGRFSYPESNYGWLVEQVGGELFIDGSPIDRDGLITFLRIKFMDSGVFENEANVLIKRIQDLNMLEFSKSFLAIRYIPTADVDSIMGLETSQAFTFMRRHFYIEELDRYTELIEPAFESISDDDFIIHETAVNKG